MKCTCCENRIWVEPTTRLEIEIFTKKGDIETGICMSVEDAQYLIEDIQAEIERVCRETIANQFQKTNTVPCMHKNAD